MKGDAHSRATSEGMKWWDANRDPAEKDRARQKMSDAHAANMWTKVKPRNLTGNGNRNHGPRRPMSEEAIQLRSLKQVQNASVKRILKDLVGVRPELIRDALIEGLMAPPPRSFPYVALAAAYLDGKPVDAEPANPQTADLSELTRDQLLARVMGVAKRLQKDSEEREVLVEELKRSPGSGLAIIDVTPLPNETPEEELARLKAEMVEAELEVTIAQIELKRYSK